MDGPGVKNFGRKRGVTKLKLPINQLLNMNMTPYCNTRLSFFSNGQSVNNATLLIQQTNDRTFQSLDVYKSVIGSKGNKIVFS